MTFWHLWIPAITLSAFVLGFMTGFNWRERIKRLRMNVCRD